MANLPEERLAVLRMVAAGTVTPEEALELLGALDPDDAPPEPHGDDPADGLIPLRVHFQLDEQEADFVLPVEQAALLSDVFAHVLELLPQEARDHVPAGLAKGWGAATVAAARVDRLLHVEDAGGPFHLQVTREASARGRPFGRRGRGFAFHG